MTTRGNDPRLTASRLARRAIVYVRHATQKQVEHNRESRELQYALVERARMLGWKRVDVIDDDLGASAGLAAAPREGFERMLAAAALGEVGIIISREASRLSRTDKDWCRLCETCQIFDTLIGDGDQLYDLTSLDDQLMLGIKGTLSVVELKVLRQRLLAGTYHKASKGQLHRTLAPVTCLTSSATSSRIRISGCRRRSLSCSAPSVRWAASGRCTSGFTSTASSFP